MKEFTIEQILEYKENFSENYLQGVFLLEDKTIEYFVAPQEINPKLPDFIFRMTNSESNEYLIAVSDSVPLELRPYFAYGEYFEFMELGIHYENRILAAQKEVLEVIPKHLEQDYIGRIIKLFSSALELNKKDKKDYPLTTNDRLEFKKTIEYLEILKEK